jgi:hypothetical protein
MGTDPTSNRICEYAVMRPLCASGRTQFIQAEFQCLLLDACQDPGDPSDAGNCIDALIDMSRTAADNAYASFACTCRPSDDGCGSGNPYGDLGYVMMLLPADVTALTTCGTNMGCTASACLDATGLGGLGSCQ